MHGEAFGESMICKCVHRSISDFRLEVENPGKGLETGSDHRILSSKMGLCRPFSLERQSNRWNDCFGTDVHNGEIVWEMFSFVDGIKMKPNR